MPSAKHRRPAPPTSPELEREIARLSETKRRLDNEVAKLSQHAGVLNTLQGVRDELEMLGEAKAKLRKEIDEAQEAARAEAAKEKQAHQKVMHRATQQIAEDRAVAEQTLAKQRQEISERYAVLEKDQALLQKAEAELGANETDLSLRRDKVDQRNNDLDFKQNDLEKRCAVLMQDMAELADTTRKMELASAKLKDEAEAVRMFAKEQNEKAALLAQCARRTEALEAEAAGKLRNAEKRTQAAATQEAALNDIRKQLQAGRENLITSREQLKTLENALRREDQTLTAKTAQLEHLKADLERREKRLKEVQRELRANFTRKTYGAGNEG